MSKPQKLYWIGSVCEHVEPVGDEADYTVGDTEPCAHCPYPKCIAAVGYVETDKHATGQRHTTP